jgi:hypothetical protein
MKLTLEELLRRPDGSWRSLVSAIGELADTHDRDEIEALVGINQGTLDSILNHLAQHDRRPAKITKP